MKITYDIGIIGAMSEEVESIISMLSEPSCEEHLGISFHCGAIGGKRVVIAKCGVGKVFAAACAAAMIINYSPKLLVNTGVGGGLNPAISVCDIVVADRLCQHDMDTSAIGDPRGMVSGVNLIWFESDKRACDIILDSARALGFPARRGSVASGDKFIASAKDKADIASAFGADVCEMEGAAVAQVAYISKTPFAVIRAISDTATDGSGMDYMEFLPIAADRSSALTLALIEKY